MCIASSMKDDGGMCGVSMVNVAVETVPAADDAAANVVVEDVAQ